MNDTAHENAPIDTEPGAQPAVPELSQLMVQLLKGVLYREDDERLWASLLRQQARVREQAAVLLLELVLDEAEGHAFFMCQATQHGRKRQGLRDRLVQRWRHRH